MKFKELVNENKDISNMFLKAISGKSKIIPFVAVFLNESTNTYFASHTYGKDWLKEFIKEVITNSRGKLKLIEILEEKLFDKKYKRIKYIDGISLDIIKEL